MAVIPNRTLLSGSAPAAVARVHAQSPVSADERFEVTVRLRRKAPLPAAHASIAATVQARSYMTREEYAATHGADPADIAKVVAFAQQAGLVVVDTSVARRSVFLSGTAQQFVDAFDTEVEQVELDSGVSRRRTKPITLPADLADIVEGVFGIGDTPTAIPHFQVLAAPAVMRAGAAASSFTPPELAKLYNFPTGLDGAGQCIGIIELGGGYRSADIKAYFRRMNLPVPQVKTISVDGAKNRPTNANSADGEVMLDIEVAAAIAPKALIAVYFAPNTDKGFLDAITMAIHDTVNKPSVISISWGNPEKNWTAQAMQSFDQAFQTAAALGVTICCAAGDAGSGDENPDHTQPDGLAHADFPGSSPAVLCCGGTRLTAAGVETVWNDDPLRSAGGGGVSDFFPLPAYQAAAGVPASANPGGRVGRGVPDVAADADPVTGYMVRVDGHEYVFGGTSAVAPLWAGLIALMNQKLGKPVGFLNPLLYDAAVSKASFRDITTGNIGAYEAKPGWDACTGLGSPNGANLLHALGG
ncbi:S53 family peptidase [Massilia sp. R2A-15]|uniref:S53 family peptidase n=1 Tax=Massilia sp. R2A-15 TaxID=3064278 RepID=UPI002733101B|nr:S53 family peptidase [Massilia sp. R2A-15]WLI91156.1 S53 family peptidase [Massilia sp. R2A-15]